MKTYLVTGGYGFIGSHYIRYVLKNPTVNVINLDCLTYAADLSNLQTIQDCPRYHFYKASVCDKDALEKIFSTYEIDYIVHFAAESHVDNSIESPETFVQTNILGTTVLLNTAMKYWRTGDNQYRNRVKFLQISTDEVYGSLGTEGLFTEQSPLDPHSPYSSSKASADLLVKAFYDTYRFPINITRCSNNYGPNQHFEKFIPHIIQCAYSHKPIPVYGDGLQIRDWLYVEDHCTAIQLVLERGILGEIYNVGGNNEHTNLELVKIILADLGASVDCSINENLITYVADRKGHDRRYGIDSSKIQAELGWLPHIPFGRGLSDTIAYYIKNLKASCLI